MRALMPLQVAWLTLIKGKKHWFVAPPDADMPEVPSCNYTADVLRPTSTSIQCVQQPGDTLWLPENWWHATCNLDAWTVGVGGQDWVNGLAKTHELPADVVSSPLAFLQPPPLCFHACVHRAPLLSEVGAARS